MRVDTLNKAHVSCTPSMIVETLGNMEVQEQLKDLEKQKALIGYKSKELLELDALILPLSPIGENERDLKYQAFWYVLLWTGGRPGNLRKAGFTLSPQGIAVKWHGRKSDGKALRRSIFYPFSWSIPAPTDKRIIGFIESGCLMNIGTEISVASCINQWLNKWLTKNHPSFTKRITSTYPRVYIDKIAREKLESGEITRTTFISMLDHTPETSDHHYID